MGSLTQEQRAAVDSIDRGVVLTAAAGSGKTTVLVERYLALLRSGKTPREILTVTFTVEAAEQMRHRIYRSLVHEDSMKAVEALESSWIGTLHGLCYRLIADESGDRRRQEILSGAEWTRLFHETYEAWFSERTRSDVHTLLSYCSHHDLAPALREYLSMEHAATKAPSGSAKLALLWSQVAPLFEGFKARFHSVTLEQRKLTFDDLEHIAYDRLSRGVIKPKFKSILVDEFQDTSPIQWRILELLSAGALRRIFAVGDPRQSIYRFRKADVTLFRSLTQSMEQQGEEVLELCTNFRSAPPILDFINRCQDLLFPGAHFSPLVSGSPNKQRSAVHQIVFSSTADETSKVADSITTLAQQGVPLDQIAILFRSSDRMVEFSRVLEQRGIRSFYRRSDSPLHSREVMDLISFLKAVEDPLDSLALADFLISRFGGLSAKDFAPLLLQRGVLFEWLCEGKLPWFVELIESRHYSTEQCLEALLQNWNRGMSPSLSQNTLHFLSWLTPLTQSVSSAVERIHAWERHEVNLTRVVGVRRNSVALMTVHGAKGLEWEHVYLVDLAKGRSMRWPCIAIDGDGELVLRFKKRGAWQNTPRFEAFQEREKALSQAEERRLLYVAMTRAKTGLYLTLPSPFPTSADDTWAHWLQRALEGGT